MASPLTTQSISPASTHSNDAAPFSLPVHLMSNLKLDSQNYPQWRSQIEPLLVSSDLYSFLDATSVAPPPKTLPLPGGGSVPNPKYHSWYLRDQQILTLIQSTLAPDAMAVVVDCTTSRQMWLALESAFSPQLPLRVKKKVRYLSPLRAKESVRCLSPEDFAKLFESHPTKWQNLSRPPRRMHRVSPQLRMNKKTHEASVYDPILVSLGPYHHGEVAFCKAEEFKYLCLHWRYGNDEEKKREIYNEILNEVDEVRNSYADACSVDKYEDTALALMMLLDTCFILTFMEVHTSGQKSHHWHNYLGVAAAVPFTARDIMVLENQVPFFILKMLISKQYGENEGIKLLHKFLGWMLSVETEHVIIAREAEDPPLHILEACWRVLAEKPANNAYELPQRIPNSSNRKLASYHTCPSVTDLKAKGISIRPSSSHSLKDAIKFDSYRVWGRLRLPVRFVSDQTQVTLSNMIAYEISPDNETDLAVLSYTNFMKSLIETPEDVKELQRKGIFRFNKFADLEQVVWLFKSIDTYGLGSMNEDVMQQIGEHCNNRGKTWMAELVHSKLHSPWTIIALLVTMGLLVLGFLQAYYTVNPISSGRSGEGHSHSP